MKKLAPTVSCLVGGKLGDGLCAFGDSMLTQFSGKHKTDSSLDLSTRESGFLVVSSQLASLGSNTFKDVVDEGVHDGHALGADARVGVHLLQHLVDVAGVAGGVRLFAALGSSVGLLGGLLGLARRFAGLLSGSLSTARRGKKCEEQERRRE